MRFTVLTVPIEHLMAFSTTKGQLRKRHGWHVTVSTLNYEPSFEVLSRTFQVRHLQLGTGTFGVSRCFILELAMFVV